MGSYRKEYFPVDVDVLVPKSSFSDSNKMEPALQVVSVLNKVMLEDEQSCFQHMQSAW